VRRYVLLTAALAALCLAFAPAPFPKKDRYVQRDDLETMQGLWRMTSYDSNGRPIGHSYKVRIKGNNWTFISINGAQESDTATYTYNLDYKVSPRAFEWTYGPNSNSGWVGSYRLENGGKKLTVIFGSGTLKTLQNRPTDFNGTPTYKMTLEYLSR
jgi:uncharacterized protein (TIGR03067 family)